MVPPSLELDIPAAAVRGDLTLNRLALHAERVRAGREIQPVHPGDVRLPDFLVTDLDRLIGDRLSVLLRHTAAEIGGPGRLPHKPETDERAAPGQEARGDPRLDPKYRFAQETLHYRSACEDTTGALPRVRTAEGYASQHKASMVGCRRGRGATTSPGGAGHVWQAARDALRRVRARHRQSFRR